MSYQLYCYLFDDGLSQHAYSNVAHVVTLDGLAYQPVTISHTAPTFSSDPSQARITVRLKDDLVVALNYISHPPPFKTLLTIYEVIETTQSGNTLVVTRFEPHWTGRIMRIAWRDSFRTAELTCRTQQDVYFGRESNKQGLDPLCRFYLGDGRCPVNIDDYKEGTVITVVGADQSLPTIEVSGLVNTNTYYVPGMIRLSDGDMRQIEACATSGGNKLLTLSRAFPATGVQVGNTVEIFAGDDLTLEVCSTVFGAATNGGEAWGGWKLTPNRDYQRDGLA